MVLFNIFFAVSEPSQRGFAHSVHTRSCWLSKVILQAVITRDCCGFPTEPQLQEWWGVEDKAFTLLVHIVWKHQCVHKHSGHLEQNIKNSEREASKGGKRCQHLPVRPWQGLGNSSVPDFGACLQHGMSWLPYSHRVFRINRCTATPISSSGATLVHTCHLVVWVTALISAGLLVREASHASVFPRVADMIVTTKPTEKILQEKSSRWHK